MIKITNKNKLSIYFSATHRRYIKQRCEGVEIFRENDFSKRNTKNKGLLGSVRRKFPELNYNKNGHKKVSETKRFRNILKIPESAI